MSEEKQNNNQSKINVGLAEIIKAINRFHQEVTITKVMGECPYGHKEGEKHRVTISNSDGLCGSLFQAIHPSIAILEYGGEVLWESNKDSFEASCPEMGRVQVKVKRFENENPTRHLKTKADFKDMTGKGFSCLDKHRVFIEVLDMDKSCMWGHKKGETYEVDPFNVGGICGNLYWEIYSFIHLLYTGGGMPWEGNKNIVHGTCPDPYNLLTYRLIREER
jgi:uncharacterized repeat protein (TIGR04076 family)